MTSRNLSRAALWIVLALPAFLKAQDNVMTIDATAPAAMPQPVTAKLGTAKNPRGDTIGVNSQYLTLNGKPWIPVMGEFHFSRYPEAQWEEEILKMKAAGVQIISTYIIWIHHEQEEGKFDWTGQRDLRKFVALCGKHGMYVYPRIGPWAHAEVRNGGLPDWVLKNSPTRQNNPVYLKEVDTFYKQIAAQLKGQLWKDGGPVVGLQVENEYRARGAGKGEEHIRTLKQMAIADGMDVPLYTVTGWDGAAIPLDAALPVFGGYPDAPWDGSPKKLPPNEVYAYRFNNRVSGSMGAIGGGQQSAAAVYRGTPFFTAEVGDGIEDTYFRRPVVSADDVAAIPQVMLGSGANLLGYYMFHGGRNPDGGDITLQESQITNYPTDVPTRSYDFQAPLGEFGQVRESLRKLKLVHYFLNDFGSLLAPMEPHAPSRVPANPSDGSMVRLSARTHGDAGFVFVSNYVRGLNMPQRDGFQVELKLPSGRVKIPQQPISLPADRYGIWPVNLALTGTGPATTLRYSTAQLFKRVENGGKTYFFFFAIPDVRPEFAFAEGVNVTSDGPPLETLHEGGLARLMLSASEPTGLHLPGNVEVVVLPQGLAEQVWRVDTPSLLLLTNAMAFSDGATWTLQSTDEVNHSIAFTVFGSQTQPGGASVPLVKRGNAFRLFASYAATMPVVHLQPTFTLVHAAGALGAPKFGPPVSWRKNPVPLAPDDTDFAQAAVWKIDVPAAPAGSSLSDAFLEIDYEGDAARLYRDSGVVDDNFWNGLPWTVGLRETDPQWQHTPTQYTLRVAPLSKSHGTYLEQADQLHFDANGIADALRGVRVVPQVQLVATT
jgi:beta-galactosidase